MTWKKSLIYEIENNNFDIGYFTLQEFYRISYHKFKFKYPNNNTIRYSIQGNLQKLRDDGYLIFANNNGLYYVNTEENKEWIKFSENYNKYLIS